MIDNPSEMLYFNKNNKQPNNNKQNRYFNNKLQNKMLIDRDCYNLQ